MLPNTECVFLQVFSFAPLLSVLIEGGSWLAVLHWSIKDWLLLVYAGAGVRVINIYLKSVIVSQPFAITDLCTGRLLSKWNCSEFPFRRHV